MFRYEYSGNFSSISPWDQLGAYHSSELPLIFGTYPNYREDLLTPASAALLNETSELMQDSWLAFMRDGAAGMAEVGWPAYTSVDGGVVREFARDGVPAVDGNERAWEALCPPMFQA